MNKFILSITCLALITLDCFAVQTHRVLIISTTLNDATQNTIYDLNRHGFGVEITTFGAFSRNYKTWFNEYDILIFGNARYSLAAYDSATCDDIYDALQYWVEHKKKIIYYVSELGNAITKIKSDGTIESKSLDPLFSISISRELHFKSGFSLEYAGDSYSHKELGEPLSKYFINSENTVFSINGDNYIPIVTTRDKTTIYNCCVFKPGESAIIGIAGSGNPDSGLLRYIDVGLLAELLLDHNIMELAMDLLYGKRIVSLAVDGDITTDFHANKAYIDVFLCRRLEIGLRTNLLNDDLANSYRNVFGDIRYCTHGVFHTAGQTISVKEAHTIDSSCLFFLDYHSYLNSSLSEMTVKAMDSDNNTIVYNRRGAGTGKLKDDEYILDLDSGTLSFSKDNIGKTIYVSYDALNECVDWIPSVEQLKQYNLPMNNAIYLSSHYHGISGLSYQRMVHNDYIMSDHIPQLARCRHFLARGVIDRVVPLTYPTWFDPITRVGFDGEVYTKTKKEAIETTVPQAYARVKETNHPLMFYTHDFITTNNTNDSRSLNYDITKPNRRFHPDWYKETYNETINYVKDFWKHMIDYFDQQDVFWMSRSDYSRLYYTLNHSISYDISGETITVTNMSNKAINGLTFRIRNGAKSVSFQDNPNRNISYSHNDNDLLVWFDISPGETLKFQVHFNR